MKEVQANELKVDKIYEIEFLSGFRMLARFTGFKNSHLNFATEDGRQFSIAENTAQYHRFYIYW
jgi:hypothetical protein